MFETSNHENRSVGERKTLSLFAFTPTHMMSTNTYELFSKPIWHLSHTLFSLKIADIQCILACSLVHSLAHSNINAVLSHRSGINSVCVRLCLSGMLCLYACVCVHCTCHAAYLFLMMIRHDNVCCFWWQLQRDVSNAFVLIQFSNHSLACHHFQLRVVGCFPLAATVRHTHSIPLAAVCLMLTCSISSVHFQNYIFTFIFCDSSVLAISNVCLRGITVQAKLKSTSSLFNALFNRTHTHQRSRAMLGTLSFQGKVFVSCMSACSRVSMQLLSCYTHGL